MTLRQIIRGVVRRALSTNDVGSYIRLRRLALKRRIYRRPIAPAQLRSMLSELGFEPGRVVWVQSSWNEFYNLPAAKPSELVSTMIEMLGPRGTLVMPAFPIDQDPCKVFEVDFAPSSSGLLTEVFRRKKGVLRSVHLSSSVCATGPMADYLLRDHHHDVFPWGKRSPFWRLGEVDAKLVCLGLGHFVTNLTPLHAAECVLYDELPYFRQLFQGTMKYQWRRSSGLTGEHEFLLRSGRIDMRGYGRHFDRDRYVERSISNLRAYSIDARYALERAIQLARKGITIYADPRPTPSLFKPFGAPVEAAISRYRSVE